MAFTVKQLSDLSGVTVRALHFYEEAGLLQPAYYGSNGYRYYEENELLQLQQILFYKELGFSLKKIQKVLGKKDHDKLAALFSHKHGITKEWERLSRLLETIDETIKHIKGEKKMKTDEIYLGFISKEKQKEYDAYLKNRFGKDNPIFAECTKNMQKKTERDHEEYRKAVDANMKALYKLMQKGAEVDSPEVQKAIKTHFSCISTFWTPNKETFMALGEMYKEFEWKAFFQAYDSEHPKFATYLADAIKVFAHNELS